MSKPFVFGVTANGKTFTDREAETKRLATNFEYGINTILISPRRWGKTSLVNKVAELVHGDQIKVVKLDIFACRSKEEFYNELATALIKQTATKIEEWLSNAKTFLSHLIPKISFGADPTQEFSISFDYDTTKTAGDEILNLPETIAKQKNIRMVICIDEFQQVGEFSDSLSFQKRLRSVWQHQEHVSYCLYGSKKHLTTELFGKRNYPFYKFGDTFFLQKIDTPHWIRFIQQRFEETGKQITSELAEKICQTAQNHSYYVQQLSWFLWLHTEPDATATEESLEEAIQDIISSNKELFLQQTRTLSAHQLNFLRAMAHGINRSFTSQQVLNSYNLGTSANVSRIKKSLINQEIIDEEEKTYTFSDPIMELWFQRARV